LDSNTAVEAGKPAAAAAPAPAAAGTSADDKPIAGGAPAPKPAEAGAAAPAKPGDDDFKLPAFQTNRDMRKWAEEQGRRAHTLDKQIKTMETEVQRLKTVQPQSVQDATMLTQKVAQLEGTIKQYEGALATHVFEQSPKYKTEFEKPYMDARNEAYGDMAQLAVNMKGPDDEEGKPTVTQRQATKRDFDAIYALPRIQARRAAKELFGEDSDIVMKHYDTVGGLANKALKVLNEHKTTYAQQMQQSQNQTRTQQLAVEQAWRTTNEAISGDPKRQEDWGTPKDDPESAEALTKGFGIADLFFSKERDAMQPAQRIAFDANIRHRIAGFSMQRAIAQKLRTENTALRAEIGQLRGSRPGAPAPVSGEQGKASPKDMNSRLDSLAD
jgi:regulator of replication initiation timing